MRCGGGSRESENEREICDASDIIRLWQGMKIDVQNGDLSNA